MKSIFYFDPTTEKTFLNTIKVLLDDIKKLENEGKKFRDDYLKNPSVDNPALYQSRAKHIEQMLILGIISEYLLKIILVKHNFVINDVKRNVKFPDEFISKLDELRGQGGNGKLIDEIRAFSEENLIASLKEKTLSFEDCKQLFNKYIGVEEYFEDTPEYEVVNEETRAFYGKKLTYPKMFGTLQNVRNNYGHVPEAKYEENGLLPFMYNFLVYIAKKEFQDFFKYFTKLK